MKMMQNALELRQLSNKSQVRVGRLESKKGFQRQTVTKYKQSQNTNSHKIF